MLKGLEIKKDFDGLVWNDEFFDIEKEKSKLLSIFANLKNALNSKDFL